MAGVWMSVLVGATVSTYFAIESRHFAIDSNRRADENLKLAKKEESARKAAETAQKTAQEKQRKTERPLRVSTALHLAGDSQNTPEQLPVRRVLLALERLSRLQPLTAAQLESRAEALRRESAAVRGIAPEAADKPQASPTSPPANP